MSRGTADWGLSSGGLQAVAEFDSYYISTTNAYAGGTSNAHIYLKNPANSGKLLTIHSAKGVLTSNLATNAGQQFVFLARTATAPVGGTIVTPVKADSNSPACSMQVLQDITNLPVFTDIIGMLAILVTLDLTAGGGRASPTSQDIELYRHDPGSAETPLHLRPGEAVFLQLNTTGFVMFLFNTLHITERPL